MRSPVVAVRPPEYLFGLPFAALLHRADCFVLADTFEYSRRSLQNRARLRTPQGAQWITVPVQGGQTHRPIGQVAIDNGTSSAGEAASRRADSHPPGAHWRSRHRRALQYDYRSTPYFEHFEPRLVDFFDHVWHRLGPCTCAATDLLADFAGIETERTRASTLPGAPDSLPGVLRTLEEPPGTLLLPPESAAYDAALIQQHAIEEAPDLRVLHFDAPRYHQAFAGFEAELSFADLLFGYGPESRTLLAESTTVTPFDADA